MNCICDNVLAWFYVDPSSLFNYTSGPKLLLISKYGCKYLYVIGGLLRLVLEIVRWYIVWKGKLHITENCDK